jgi:hypothetical protein
MYTGAAGTVATVTATTLFAVMIRMMRGSGVPAGIPVVHGPHVLRHAGTLVGVIHCADARQPKGATQGRYGQGNDHQAQQDSHPLGHTDWENNPVFSALQES